MKYLTHILITINQKAFRLGPEVQCRVSFHSMISDPRIHARGWGQRSKFSTSPELILGRGSVTITLILQYWPEILNRLRRKSRRAPSYGAFSLVLCVFRFYQGTFGLSKSSPISVLFRRFPLISSCERCPRLQFYWLRQLM